MLWAQSQPSSRKWDSRIEALMKRQGATSGAPSLSGRSAKSDTTLHVIITTDNAQALAERLQGEGFSATVINGTTITARLPLYKLVEVGNHASTRYISSSRRHRRFMNKARPAVGADKVHSGTDLQTPYTGKGVIVAVIDQGFQYNHAAFLNPTTNASRILAIWNRYQDEAPKLNPTVNVTTNRHDNILDADGHATHVAGIAAGSVRGNNYQGMAPEADLVFIPSAFTDAELLEDMKFIDSIATAQGKPWVTNMSFGSTIGPHDGTTDYDRAMSEFLQRGSGRVIAAAMGNDGENNYHAYHRFTADNDTVILLFEPRMRELGDNGQEILSDEENLFFQIWGAATDSTQRFSVTPYVYDEDVTDSPLQELATAYTAAYDSIWFPEINPNNKRESYEFFGNCDQMFSRMSAPIIVVKVTGPRDSEFHAWICEGYGKLISHTNEYTGIRPNSDYCVGEGAASIPGAVAVGAFTSAISWTDSRGRTQSYEGNREVVGNVATFSSHGPWLGVEQKPSVVAPGTVISSAVNRYDTYYKSILSSSEEITSKIQTPYRTNGYNHYYGIMEGTSMASPAVAGIVALWLEANPQLSYEDVHEIIRTTSVKHTDMGTAVWDKLYGYGKIDAYEGLKEALKKVTGIHAVHRSATPVSVQTEADAIRLLFGSVEQNVSYQLYSLSGHLVKSATLGAVAPGTETIIATNALPTGVYLLRITTPASTTTVKVIR